MLQLCEVLTAAGLWPGETASPFGVITGLCFSAWFRWWQAVCEAWASLLVTFVSLGHQYTTSATVFGACVPIKCTVQTILLLILHFNLSCGTMGEHQADSTWRMYLHCCGCIMYCSVWILGCRCDACIYGGHTWDVQVVSSGLEEETCPVVDYEECLTPAERLLPPRRQPKPGEPQVQSLFSATPLP